MRRIAAVVLAAGGSSRFGKPKQLLPFHGETLVRRAVHAAMGAGCAPVVVVVGQAGGAIRTELQETGAVIIENREWQRGLGTSVRRGTHFVTESAPDIDALVLMVCDQPLVESGTIAELVAEQEKSGKPIVASTYSGTLGVPALFEGSCFAGLLAVPDGSGAKSLIEARPDDVAPVPFQDGAVDIDTPEDWERLR